MSMRALAQGPITEVVVVRCYAEKVRNRKHTIFCVWVSHRATQEVNRPIAQFFLTLQKPDVQNLLGPYIPPKTVAGSCIRAPRGKSPLVQPIMGRPHRMRTGAE